MRERVGTKHNAGRVQHAHGPQRGVRQGGRDALRVRRRLHAVHNNVAVQRVRVVETGRPLLAHGRNGGARAVGQRDVVAHLHRLGGGQRAVDVQIVVGREEKLRAGRRLEGDKGRLGLLEAVREHVHLAVDARRGQHRVANLEVGHCHARTRLELHRGCGREARRARTLKEARRAVQRAAGRGACRNVVGLDGGTRYRVADEHRVAHGALEHPAHRSA